MKRIVLLLGVAFFQQSCMAQKVYNYDAGGDKLKTTSEFVDLSIESNRTTPGTESAIAGLLLGPVYNIISSTIQDQLKKRQQSYTATYANSAVFSYEDISQNGPKSLVIRRYAINSLNEVNEKHLMAEYVLPLTTNENSITIALNSILLKRSKARYKSGDQLSIAIHITAQDPIRSQIIPNEGTIVVPIVKVLAKPQDFSEYTRLVNKILLSNLNLSSKDQIKFVVSVRETNITHIDPTQVQKLIQNNAEDLRTILKTLMGL